LKKFTVEKALAGLNLLDEENSDESDVEYQMDASGWEISTF